MHNGILVNGQWLTEQQAASSVNSQYNPYFDRVASFGDGVFESMLVKPSGVHLYPLHIERLRRGLDILDIEVESDKIEADIATILNHLKHGSDDFYRLKLRISRGASAAGYGSANLHALRVLSYQSFMPALLPPASLMISSVNLPKQPYLAGIKHCSRLEQVLAKREQEQSRFDDALLLDTSNHVIEATSSNIFILQGDTLTTPDLSESGVAGVMRAYIMQAAAPKCGLDVQQKPITIADIKNAQGVCLSNTLAGVRLVSSCLLRNGEELKWPANSKLLQLQAHIFSALSTK